MKLVWIGFLIEILFFSLLKPFITDTEVAVICVIGVNTLFLLVGIIKYKTGLREFFYSAYVLRVFAMLLDVYGRNIFILPHSGNDSEDFLYSAILVANDLNLLKSNIYGDIYSKTLGILFYITSPERLIGHYLNVLLGITIIITVYKILFLLEVNEKTIMLAIAFISFFPHGVIFSGILLRENFISLFVTVSLYYFVKWYKHNKNINVIISFLYLAIASWFHSGVIGVAIGYVFMYMFYEVKTSKLSFSIKSFFTFIVFVAAGIFVFTQLNDVLLGKFIGIDGFDDIIGAANTRTGGSSYLRDLRTSSTWQLVLFSPVLMFYFLVSPLPMDWRGINDIVSFFMDSLIYFSLMVYSVYNIKKYIAKNPMLLCILLILLTVTLTFAIGVQNAGTAIRHRHKIFYIIVVFFALIHDHKKTKNMRQI